MSMPRCAVSVPLAIAFSVLSAGSAFADTRVVLYSTNADPLVSGETVGRYFSNPVINANGTVATANGKGGLTVYAIPRGYAPTVSVRQLATPGVPTTFYVSTMGVWLSDSASFLAQCPTNNDYSPTAQHPVGIWEKTSQSFSLVHMESGGFAPMFPVYNQAGQYAYNTGDSGAQRNLYTNVGGSTQFIMGVGGAAPSVPGSTLTSVGDPRLNDAGLVLLGADISASWGSSPAMYTVSGTTSTLLARQGDALPGYPSSHTYGAMKSQMINNAGEVGFIAKVWGTGLPASAIFLGTAAGNMQIAIAEGSDIPDRPGLKLGDLYGKARDSLLNSRGDIVFDAAITGPAVTTSNDAGLFLYTDGVVRTIYREGDAALGLPTGVKMAMPSVSRTLAFNGQGQIAFEAALTGTGVTSSNDSAYFLTDTDGVPHLIVREGTPFYADGTLYGTPASLRAAFGSGGEDGMAVALNDTGEFAFRLTFSNNTEGVFVATVPEPATLGLLAAVPLAAVIRRRRK